MAFYPANSTYPGMLGEMYSAAFTAPAFNWQCSPAVTELETIVLDWLARALHLPDCFLSEGRGGGVIQGSASEATLTCMIAARERYLKQASANLEGKAKDDKIADLKGRLVVLGSDQSHSGVAKAALIAGVRWKPIPCKLEEDLALTGEALLGALEECKRDRLEPFFLAATLGTTPTCAIDRFPEIADVVKLSPGLWVHVDAAYAGAALILEEYQYLAAQITPFDSFDMNMHKWMLTNFDASCLYVRDRTALTSALNITAPYLRNQYTESGVVIDYRDWQIPFGRRFRSMKIWFVMRTYGIQGMQAYIRNHINLGQEFASWLRERSDLFRIITPPAFALTALTLIAPGSKDAHLPNGHTESKVAEGLATADILPKASSTDVERGNAITKAVYERINAKGELFLTSSVYAIRVVAANERSDRVHLRGAFKTLVRTAEDIFKENPSKSP